MMPRRLILQGVLATALASVSRRVRARAGLLSFASPSNWWGDDGSASAGAGTPLYPTLLSSYAARPPWKVPGVDYPVGVPSNVTLKDPAAGGAPTGTTFSTSTHTVTFSADNVTLDGWDFSLEGGWGVDCSGHTGIIIQNCKIKIGTNLKLPIHASSTTGDLTIRFSEIDGSATDDSSTFDCLISYPGTGTLTVEHCYLHDAWQHTIDFSTPTSGIVPVIRWNVLKNNGVGTSGVHPDPWYNNGSKISGGQFNFNLIYDVGTSFSAGNWGMVLSTDNSLSGGYCKNNTMSYNTLVASPGSSSGVPVSYALGFAAGIDPVTGCTVNYNYCDPSTQAFGFWDSPSDPGAGCGTLGNVNMVTGVVVKSSWSN